MRAAGTAISRSRGVNSEKLRDLVALAQGYVESGELPSVQLAVGLGGEIVCAAAFGHTRSEPESPPVTDDTLYVGFSTTKAVVSSALWLLWQDGKVGLDERVVDIIPEFDTNEKETVRVEHLLTHTAGFPRAPFHPLDWADREKRLARFSQWRLDWSPGSRCRYHTSSSLWVIAEIIERRSGRDFRGFVRERVCAAAGIEDLHLGLPAELNERVATITHVGSAPDAEQLRELGLSLPSDDSSQETFLERYNQPEFREVGVPAAGGIMTATALARFYQALLGALDPAAATSVWKRETVQRGLEVRTGDLVDPITGRAANRSLGMVIAGDEQRVFRSFAVNHSPSAFGHPGIGGQIGWADPETGISFAFFTNGLERNPIVMGMRGMSLSNCAAACALPRE